jgi:hypothetical protein
MMIDIKKLRKCYKESIHSADMQNIEPLINATKITTEFNSTQFAPLPTKEYFRKCDKCLKISSDTSALAYYVYYVKDLETPIAKIMESYHQASTILKYFGIAKYINVYMIMAPYKRLWPNSGQLIEPEHINGGFTSRNSNDIYIIRSEEFGKVIIHEILHHCDEVHKNNWTQYQIENLKAHFNISKDAVLIPNEAVVELWATIIYCIFMYFQFGTIVHWKKLLNIELKHSIKQSNKIFEMQAKMKTGWNEHSNAYPYIVFKTILLKHYENIPSWDPQTITNVLIRHKESVMGFKDPLDEDVSSRLMIIS